MLTSPHEEAPAAADTMVWRPATVPWKAGEARHADAARDGPAVAGAAATPLWMGPPVRTSNGTGPSSGDATAATAQSMDERWTALQRLAQASEVAFRGMSEAAARQRSETATHQKEIAAYQESQRALATQQQQRIDTLTHECAQLRQSEAGMKEVVAHQADRLAALETELQFARVQLTEISHNHLQCVDERNGLQQTCKTHEVHITELQASLRFADEVVRSMRETVAACEREKDAALAQQYAAFEKYRTDLVAVYDKRAEEALAAFAVQVAALQATMLGTVAKREEQLKAGWEDTAAKLRHEYDEVVRLAHHRRAAMDTELRERKEQMDRDKEAMRSQMREEAEATEHRFRAREEALLDDIARRERELREREAGLRAAQVQQEVDMQRRLQARETELRAAHDAASKRMTDQAAAEREKLSEGFMERLQQLSNAHMQQERELERMHREKEREMAQRYRLNGLEGPDRGDARERRPSEYTGVGSDMAKEALLKRFESVEQRQRERSDKLRSAFAATDSEPRTQL